MSAFERKLKQHLVSYRIAPGAARRYAPSLADGSSIRCGSMSVRGRVRSPHISGGPRRRGHDNLWPCLGHDLHNILRQSYDYVTIMPKLRSTYDGRVVYKKILRITQVCSWGTIHLRNRKIVFSEIVFVHKLIRYFPKRNLSTL